MADDLAQSLTHVAAQAIYGAAYGQATKRKAERAVVAVLRKLADELERERDYYGMRTRLRRLADSIEKGES